MIATVSLHLDDEPPRVTTLQISDTGERFITAHVGGVSLIFHGFDAASAALARQLATALTAAADSLDADLAAAPAAVGSV